MNQAQTLLSDSDARAIQLPESPAFGPDPSFKSWFQVIEERLKDISQLEQGWDGYEGAEISHDVLDFAHSALDEIMIFDTPAPRLVPMSNGSLMLEWDQNDIELEIEINGPGSIWASLEDRRGEVAPFEGQLSFDFSALRTGIEILTRRSRPFGG